MKLKDYCSERGKKADLSKKTGLSPAFINQILKGTRPIPVHHAASIEVATEGFVSRKDMFPDDWAAIWPELAEQKD